MYLYWKYRSVYEFVYLDEMRMRNIGEYGERFLGKGEVNNKVNLFVVLDWEFEFSL